MTKKTGSSISKRALKLILVIPAIVSLAGNLLSLVKLEAASMRKRIIIFFALALFSFALMLSFWLCVNALILNYMVSLHISVMAALGFLITLNLLLLIITLLSIALLDFNASFPETRKAIKQLLSDDS